MFIDRGRGVTTMAPVFTDRFNKLIQFVFEHEGRVYEEVVGDPGGCTKYGISHQAYPKLDIKNLTEDQAKQIYWNDYWLPLKCDSYVTDKLALAVFDSAVNCGTGTVNKWLANGLPTSAESFLYKRIRRYADLCQKNKVLNQFLLGWIIRVLHIVERY